MANDTNSTLVQITPRPTCSPRIEDPEDIPALRRLDCRSYDGCLDIAVNADWRGFHCNDCKAYEKQTPAEARRDYFATLEFLADTQLLAGLRQVTFRTSSLIDDEQEPDGAQLRFGFTDAGQS